VHINLFGPHQIVVKGTAEQKARWVPRLVAGEDQCCFGFTEPDAGLDTTRIRTFTQKVAGGYLVHGQKVWTSIGQDALRRAANYARERVVFDQPIGQNQGIQHPLAENWMYLESAWQMAMRAAWLYDRDKPCGAEAKAAKFLGARAGHDAAWQAIATHGGFGYAKEYHVERLFREVAITRLAPITEQLILSFIAEKVLELPKSY
jgi:alkylation response protein AidB-like acyl-CoA dehydrogenase